MNDRQNGQQAAGPQPLYITLILDESGSMQSCKGAALAGTAAQRSGTAGVAHRIGRKAHVMKTLGILILVLLWTPASLQAEDLGNLSANPFDAESTANPFGKGSQFAPNGINNPFSPYGSPFSNRSVTNPFATDAPRLYDQQGHYRGKLSANPFDQDSTSNQFGRYGSPFSPDSLNNQFGAGNPFRPDSPNNPYGKGWRIEGGK